jgi:hypothetical protein
VRSGPRSADGAADGLTRVAARGRGQVALSRLLDSRGGELVEAAGGAFDEARAAASAAAGELVVREQGGALARGREPPAPLAEVTLQVPSRAASGHRYWADAPRPGAGTGRTRCVRAPVLSGRAASGRRY